MKEDLELVSQSLPFSRKEVEDLAEKLARIGHDLSDPEQNLLVAVFTAARDHVTVPGTPPVNTSKDLRRRILEAFVPNAPNAAIGNREFLITSRIGTDPVIHGPGPTGPGHSGS